MSAHLSKEASVTRWLRNNVAFTNNFVVNWVAEHPELRLGSLDAQPVFPTKQKKLFKSQLNASACDLTHKHRSDVPHLKDLFGDPVYTVLLKDILSTKLDLDSLSIKIAKSALLLTKGAECSVFLIEDNALVPRALNVIASRSSKQIQGDQLRKVKPLSFPIGQGIVGNVVRNGTTICTENGAKVSKSGRGGWG